MCGFEYRQSEMKERWDGVLVCKYDFEHRHPQDFVRGVKDDSSPVGHYRPEPEDEFIAVSSCLSTTSRAGIAISGCMRANSEYYNKTSLNENTIPTGTF